MGLTREGCPTVLHGRLRWECAVKGRSRREALRRAAAGPAEAADKEAEAAADAADKAADKEAEAAGGGGKSKLPEVDDRYFVPAWLWPKVKPMETKHGKGWLASVVSVNRAEAVRFQCDGEAAPAAMALGTFREHCMLVGMAAEEAVAERLDAQIEAALAKCTVPLSPVEVEDLLWSIHLAQARGGDSVCKLADNCYAVLRDEAGGHPKLPGGYSILYLKHDPDRRTLLWSCSCPAYARSVKRFGGKSFLGGAKLCPCGTMVLLARLASRPASKVVDAIEDITLSAVGPFSTGDDCSSTDTTERAPYDVGAGVFDDSIDLTLDDIGGDPNLDQHSKKVARASAIAKAMLSGPRLPPVVSGPERAELQVAVVRSSIPYLVGGELDHGTNSTLLPSVIHPLEVLQHPVNPRCPTCAGTEVLLRVGETAGTPVWVLCGKVLEQRRMSDWRCSGKMCRGGLLADGRFRCMGVPWTIATGLVNVRNSFFVDRITLQEMRSWVFGHGVPVLVSASQAASRASDFMLDVTAGAWVAPSREWLHQQLYLAFWWEVGMKQRPTDALAGCGLVELPDVAVLPPEERQHRLLSEEELYTICEERIVSLAAGGCARRQSLPVYRVPPILHPGIRGTPRNTEHSKKTNRWSAQAMKDLRGVPRPTTKCFAALSQVIAKGFDAHSLRDPSSGLAESEIDKVLAEIGAKSDLSGASCAQKKAFLCCACFSLVNVGETDCHTFVQAVMGTGGLATMSCPHGYSYGWKFLVGGAESVRDSKDLLKSNKIWPPLTVMDVPCGFTAHMEASERDNAHKAWGTRRGCWRDFVWGASSEMDLTPISKPEYASEARAHRLAEIANDPATAALLASRGELLLQRHPLLPPLGEAGGSSYADGIGVHVMCDAFHQGMAALHHKADTCKQHNVRMCPQINDIPTTFMESINKLDKLHLRSVCVQDPGVLAHRRAHGCTSAQSTA